MIPDNSSHRRKRTLVTTAIVISAIACGILATLSFMNQKLYTPFGILVSNDSSPGFYFGISIYITIGVTLFTSALIRIGLDLSK